MSFNFQNLEPFVQEVSQDIIIKSLLTGRTTSKATPYKGIKLGSTQNINKLDISVDIIDATCSPSYTGDDTFTVRPMYVAPLMIAKKYCPGELDKYWTGQLRKSGATEEIPFIQGITDAITNNIANFNENLLWQGVLGSTASDYNKIDGYFKILGATSVSPVGVTAAAGPHTTSNIVAHVDAMIAAIPQNILFEQDLTLFMDMTTFQKYSSAVRTAFGFYALDPRLNSDNYMIQVPNQNITVVGTVGFGTSDKLVLTPWSNLAYGVDLEGDAENINFIYDPITRNDYVNGVYGLGAQILIPEYCVINF